jgi:PhoPQ-activated pathogenicity-related protein
MRRTIGLWMWCVYGLVNPAASVLAGPLDDYVARPDTTYAFRLESVAEGPGVTGYIIGMTSQQWRSAAEVNHPQWEHWLQVVVPARVSNDTALLMIGGGSTGNPAPGKPSGMLVEISRRTGSVTAEIATIPNEPLRFAGEDRERSEDAIIAYSWEQFRKTGDTTWPVQLAMVKSAVRAMDTVQRFTAELAGRQMVRSFVVSGASKRGWTTWLTGAADKRVRAIIPVVIDMLNTQASFRHHRAVYGFYAPAVHDYEEMGIFQWIQSPESDRLMAIVDPFNYRDRLTMPKFLIHGTQDEFFLPDSSRYYFDGLKGPKYLRYVPNAGHGLKDSDALESLAAFYQAIVDDAKLPQFAWEQTGGESVKVTAVDRPRKVLLWQGHNPKSRDFRIDVLGPVWKSTELADQGGGVYAGKVDRPGEGFRAFMVELTYDSGFGRQYKFTTPVFITPDTEPFAQAMGE